jgi:hypothetical protein
MAHPVSGAPDQCALTPSRMYGHVSQLRDCSQFGGIMDAKPSQSELVILKQLWREGELSAREVHDQAFGALQWSY